jgi:hypothetical protein
MAKVKTQPRLGAPIPGMSLTSEPGNRPWEKPPRIVDVDEAITFYVERLTEPDTAANILDQVEDGMPIALMTDMLQTGAVAKGIHSLDVGIIVSPAIIEIIKAMAEDLDISYVIGNEKESQVKKPDRAILKRTIAEVLDSEDVVEDTAEDIVEDTDMPMEEAEVSMPAEERKGLMARKGAE